MSPQAPAWVNVAAITGFIAFIAIILTAITGIAILSRSSKGDMKKAASQVGVTFIGLFILGVALVSGIALAIINGTTGFFIKP